MSTMGRDADKFADRCRKRERWLAENAITLRGAVVFTMQVLTDAEITDADARKVAFEALKIGRAA